MPHIINYIHHANPSTRTYDETELARLQAVFDRACAILDIEVGDPRRETIAVVVFQVADLSNSPDELLMRTLAMINRPASGSIGHGLRASPEV